MRIILTFIIFSMIYNSGFAAENSQNPAETPPSAGAERNLPDGLESYEIRPHIFNVIPRSWPDLATAMDTPWRDLCQSYLNMVAAVLGLYDENFEIYFLARDTESAYDLAELVTQFDPANSKRIHLLNVSRESVDDPHLLDYLAQEGISADRLKAGLKVLFVDIGYYGNQPIKIINKFPEILRENFFLHMQLSDNIQFPSLRSSLMEIDPIAASAHLHRLLNKMLRSEWMERYTARSTSYSQGLFDRRWHPMSDPTTGADNGSVNRAEALQLMEDLKYFYSLSEPKQKYLTLFEIYQRFSALRRAGDAPALAAELKRFIVTYPDKTLAEAAARDVVDTFQKNFHFPISLADAGLVEFARPVVRTWRTPIEPGNLLQTDQGRSIEIIKELEASRKDFQNYRVVDKSSGDLYLLQVTSKLKPLSAEFRSQSRRGAIEVGEYYILRPYRTSAGIVENGSSLLCPAALK